MLVFTSSPSPHILYSLLTSYLYFTFYSLCSLCFSASLHPMVISSPYIALSAFYILPCSLYLTILSTSPLGSLSFSRLSLLSLLSTSYSVLSSSLYSRHLTMTPPFSRLSTSTSYSSLSISLYFLYIHLLSSSSSTLFKTSS